MGPTGRAERAELVFALMICAVKLAELRAAEMVLAQEAEDFMKSISSESTGRE